MMTSRSKQLSPSDYWRTPSDFLERVRKIAPIALDPCGTADNWTRARHCYTEGGPVTESPEGDGLAIDWPSILMAERPGLVFCNPPYSSGNLPVWTEKLASAQGCERLGLLPANTDTRWFQEFIFGTGATVCFLRGRVRFVDAFTGQQGGCGRFASVACYWGRRRASFRREFWGAGWIT